MPFDDEIDKLEHILSIRKRTLNDLIERILTIKKRIEGLDEDKFPSLQAYKDDINGRLMRMEQFEAQMTEIEAEIREREHQIERLKEQRERERMGRHDKHGAGFSRERETNNGNLRMVGGASSLDKDDYKEKELPEEEAPESDSDEEEILYYFDDRFFDRLEKIEEDLNNDNYERAHFLLKLVGKNFLKSWADFRKDLADGKALTNIERQQMIDIVRKITECCKELKSHIHLEKNDIVNEILEIRENWKKRKIGEGLSGGKIEDRRVFVKKHENWRNYNKIEKTHLLEDILEQIDEIKKEKEWFKKTEKYLLSGILVNLKPTDPDFERIDKLSRDLDRRRMEYEMKELDKWLARLEKLYKNFKNYKFRL